MAQVAYIEDYRARKRAQAAAEPRAPKPPHIHDGEIMSRDYTRIGDVAFGILKIREILAYHLYLDDAWPRLTLDLLHEAFLQRKDNQPQLHEAAQNLKDHIMSEMTPETHQNLSTALLIADLIEKAPLYKQ
ncbi:MAG: hypothetical protein AB1916_14210 [Thermodesulfobacteriota bacterium]